MFTEPAESIHTSHYVAVRSNQCFCSISINPFPVCQPSHHHHCNIRPYLLLRATCKGKCHCYWRTLRLRSTGRFSAHCVETPGGRCACSAHTSALRSALSVVTTVRTTFRSSHQLTSELQSGAFTMLLSLARPEADKKAHLYYDDTNILLAGSRCAFCLIPKEDWLGRDAV
jgi:hypothetical protein